MYNIRKTCHTISPRTVGIQHDVAKKKISYSRKRTYQLTSNKDCRMCDILSEKGSTTTRQRVSHQTFVLQTNASFVVTQDSWEWHSHLVRLVICIIMERLLMQTNRTDNFSREVMNLPCLNTCGNTSVNTDQTRHPSYKNVWNGNQHSNHQPQRQHFGSYNRLIWTTIQDHEKILHESTTLNNSQTLPKTLTQYRLLTTCSATLTAKQQVDEWRIACHLRFPAGMTWFAHTYNTEQNGECHTPTSDLCITWHPSTTRTTTLHNNCHIFEKKHRKLIEVDMEHHPQYYSSTDLLVKQQHSSTTQLSLESHS